ncbi:MAG: heavy-metal-associated domain-containing protein [Treponema sp.]|jgi:copper chaperone CopZ|nr:heavy-metal-associated domain-containing protein [Treponema sp.]
MKTLSVPGMHCQMCVKNITRALDTAGIKHNPVSLETKTVEVDVDESGAKKACGVLDDIGFEATVK